MGDRKTMASRQLHDPLRGAPRGVSLFWSASFDTRGLPARQGSDLGSVNQANHPIFPLPSSLSRQRLVRGIGSFKPSLQSDPRISPRRNSSASLRPLVPSISQSPTRHPRLPLVPSRQEGQPLISSSLRLQTRPLLRIRYGCASARESLALSAVLVFIIHHSSFIIS